MQKNFENIVIEKIITGGVGLATLGDGKKILLKGDVVPGMTVNCYVKKKKKDYIEGGISSIISYPANIQPIKPICSHCVDPISPSAQPAHKVGCGGCKWQSISYENQLLIKEKMIEDSWRGVDQFSDARKGEVSGTSQPLHYRNKIEFSFGKYLIFGENQEFHERNIGFHKKGEFSKVLDVDQCFLVSEPMHQIFSYLKQKTKESNLPVYYQKTHRGFFRHLVLRQGVNTKQLMVNLVVADKFFTMSPEARDQRDSFKNELIQDKFLSENCTTFVVTYNNGLADIVQGQDTRQEILRGDGYIFEELHYHKFGALPEDGSEKTTARFRVSPFSFFQVNTLGAQQLFSRAMEFVGNVDGMVLDLYCGAGTIGLSLLANGIGDELIGVEIGEDAIVDAQYNAKINNLTNRSYFRAGKAEKIIFEDTHIQSRLPDMKLIVIDPPRDGLHKSVVDFLIQLKQNYAFKLLYISCNPQTMARDCDLLIKGGFKLKTLEAVDMFPQTHHVESLGLLY
ncbi:MAG TPA: 23S rRNA (uracil(1939)-C(5))-methyltransferase RlmD [Candidatus Absconditabacterales bacterium]|nr:23S rRNA (uracil(1939)-C(5))-methyltransferase RlmD [Candidatus Absconditabacterales bacterium]